MAKIEEKQESRIQQSLENYKVHVGTLLFVGIVLLCFIGPFFSDQSYETTRLEYGAQPPSLEHFFGTDELVTLQ